MPVQHVYLAVLLIPLWLLVSIKLFFMYSRGINIYLILHCNDLPGSDRKRCRSLFYLKLTALWVVEVVAGVSNMINVAIMINF